MPGRQDHDSHALHIDSHRPVGPRLGYRGPGECAEFPDGLPPGEAADNHSAARRHRRGQLLPQGMGGVDITRDEVLATERHYLCRHDRAGRHPGEVRGHEGPALPCLRI
ncbi:MAG: hypothetical protein HW405_685 [Candidatus Berkelbacteria bacterium]|nr:hypothetical protein [Candidatus Berkelbacteria bacterium]